MDRLHTAKELGEWFVYDSQAGTLRWKKAPGMRMKVGQAAGTLVTHPKTGDTPYIRVTLRGVSYMAHVIAWTLGTGRKPRGNSAVHAVDGDYQNLKLSNLRTTSS